MELSLYKLDPHLCDQEDAIIARVCPCPFINQMRYGRKDERKYRQIQFALMQLDLINRMKTTDNVLGNAEDAEIGNERILVHGDSFGILITVD